LLFPLSCIVRAISYRLEGLPGADTFRIESGRRLVFVCLDLRRKREPSLIRSNHGRQERAVAVKIAMPSLGQTTDDLLIVEWLKREGEAVSEGEPLLLVQTDKATLEVESVASGTLLGIARGAGEMVQAGTVIA